MKLLRIATAVAALAASTSVLAAGEFEGPWAGLGMGFRGTVTKVTGTNGIFIDSVGRDSVFGIIQGGYAWRVNWEGVGDFNLGPYAFYYIGSVESNDRNVDGTIINAKWKNQFGIGMQPGYYLTKDSVVYLKAGFNHVKLELNATSPGHGQISPDESFTGPAIGLGLKTQVTPEWIIWVDAQEVFFSSKDFNVGGVGIEVRPRMVMGAFGFGYQF